MGAVAATTISILCTYMLLRHCNRLINRCDRQNRGIIGLEEIIDKHLDEEPDPASDHESHEQ